MINVLEFYNYLKVINGITHFLQEAVAEYEKHVDGKETEYMYV